MEDDRTAVLTRTAKLAQDYLGALPEAPVGRPVPAERLRDSLGGPLPEAGEESSAVIERLAAAAAPGIVATAGPRYFGFVTGGSLPAALAADWLASVWDQPAFGYVAGPSAAVVEEVAAGWLVELFGLGASGREISVGFTTGCTLGNFTALAAARHALLARTGWDVEADGLFGAPPFEVVVGDEAHVSVFVALQMLGLGRARVRRAAADAQGRMRPDALAEVLDSCTAPAIVCAQAGNVNSGAFDPLEPISAICRRHDAWLHVDGAFGLWAAAAPSLRHLTAGLEGADSWATDGHKWLNVPYDSGLVMVAHPAAHRAAMTISAAYLIRGEAGEREPYEWVPEASRRARGFPVYAALRNLGRGGLAELIERCSTLARRMAERLQEDPLVEIMNEVVLNQVVVRFRPPKTRDSDLEAGDSFTQRVIAAVQQDGTCWAGGTTWRGKAAMRISVSNWSTTAEDIDRSADAILRRLRRLA